MNHSLKYFEKFFWNTQENPYIDTIGNTEHTTFGNLEGKTKGKALQFCWRLVETVPRFEPFPLLQFSLSTTNAKLFSTLEPLFQFRIKRAEWIDLYFFFSKALMCFAVTFILSQFERMFGRMQLLHLETKLPHLYLFSKAHQKWLHFFKLFSFFWSNLEGSWTCFIKRKTINYQISKHEKVL